MGKSLTETSSFRLEERQAEKFFYGCTIEKTRKQMFEGAAEKQTPKTSAIPLLYDRLACAVRKRRKVRTEKRSVRSIGMDFLSAEKMTTFRFRAV